MRLRLFLFRSMVRGGRPECRTDPGGTRRPAWHRRRSIAAMKAGRRRAVSRMLRTLFLGERFRSVGNATGRRRPRLCFCEVERKKEKSKDDCRFVAAGLLIRLWPASRPSHSTDRRSPVIGGLYTRYVQAFRARFVMPALGLACHPAAFLGRPSVGPVARSGDRPQHFGSARSGDRPQHSRAQASQPDAESLRDTVQNADDGVGAVENVEVNAGNAGGKQAFDLSSAVIDADRNLRLGVVLVLFQVFQELFRKA
jgi:hypothetical protein